MLSLLSRVLAILAVLWLIRVVWRALFDKASRSLHKRRSASGSIASELFQDPQCGTYVAPQVSIKTRLGNKELHFCSRKCQEEFLRAHGSA